ncbi:MAG: hypothetical protein VB861_17465 [Planctomycetaceae bacterium]|jgi:D-galactarolactone cycloisomerase
MRITEIESIILQHDMQEELGFAQGYYDRRTAHLVKVHTDEGLTGIGIALNEDFVTKYRVG